MGLSEAAGALRARFAVEPDAQVRAAITRALGRLGR
jgi:hypothetical protein